MVQQENKKNKMPDKKINLKLLLVSLLANIPEFSSALFSNHFFNYPEICLISFMIFI